MDADFPAKFIYPRRAWEKTAGYDESMQSDKSHSGAADAAALAKKFGFSQAAVEAARDALARGNGGAQFSNDELGGSVQWMRGGMLQIGDMFNHDLKARVADLMEALSKSPPTDGAHESHEAHEDKSARASKSKPIAKSESSGDWWPKELGKASTVGGQNDHRYAFFPDKRRLVVEEKGKQTLYDTGSHKISGAAQGQATGKKDDLAFSDADGGSVNLRDLKVVND